MWLSGGLSECEKKGEKPRLTLEVDGVFSRPASCSLIVKPAEGTEV